VKLAAQVIAGLTWGHRHTDAAPSLLAHYSFDVRLRFTLTTACTVALPVLTDNRWLRLLAFAGLYAAQGLPWGVFIVAIPTWLAGQGHSATEVGLFIAIVTLPWTFKLFSGPVMDRFTFPSLGRRRPWVIIAQLVIVAGSLLLAAGENHFTWLLVIGIIVNVGAAIQDVAVDGMAIDILPESERARANSFMYGGQVFGISGSSAGGAYLLSNYGVGVTGFILALTIAIIALIPIFLRERPGEKLLPWTEGNALERTLEMQETRWRTIFVDLFKVVVLPMSLLLIFIKIGDRTAVGILTAAFPIITTQELGHPETFYPEWNALAGIFAAVFGILIAPIIDWLNAHRALLIGLTMKVIALTSIGLTVDYWSNDRVMISVLFLIAFISQWLTIASISLFMHLCAIKVSASQFAIYMAASNLALSMGSSLFGPLDSWLDYNELIYMVALIDLFALTALLFFNLERHQKRLEALGPGFAGN